MSKQSFKGRKVACSIAAALLLTNSVTAEYFTVCRETQLAAPPGAPASGRHYAPSRRIDILHLALDVTPDFKQRSVKGKVTLRFKPIARPLEEVRLDGVDLTVDSTISSEPLAGWNATDKDVTLTFAQPLPAGKEASVTVSYETTPTKGLYFRTPGMGYKPEDMHLWTQGEPIEARHWYPSFDAPNEKFTSEVICRVPEGMVVLSNGKLVSEEKEPGSGLLAVRWLQDKPHVNYLIALVAGHFKKVEDKFKDIPIALYTPASQIDQAMHSFKDLKDMMGFFEEQIGFPYPWAKYYQVCINDFHWGGMENTTLTVLNDRTLHTPDFENLRESDGLIAHELAHQWFGDLLTCKDWAHLWLNEGFATYYEQLYEGHKHGPEELQFSLYQSAKHITGQLNQTNAIVRRDYREPEEQFSFLVYPKGAWVLHMLRSQVGDELYRRCVKTYVERHQFGNVETEDLNAVFEELSGHSFDQFFDQWVYHAGYPDLAVSYAWDEKTKLAKLSIQQNQKLSDDVLLFSFPFKIRFKLKQGGTVDRDITISKQAEDFYFALAEPPQIVRLDPELTVLAKIDFIPPSSMLNAQLTNATDMLGRLMAVEQFKGKKESLVKLRDALNNDPFYGIRVAAADGIRAIQTDEALEALLASTKQPDARVRRHVLSAINGFYCEPAYERALTVAEEEKNPDIRAAAITALGGYPKPEVREKLLAFLKSDSYRNVLADAAINAIRAQGDPSYIEPLCGVLKQREDRFESGGFARGLETLALLARDEDNKYPVRSLLLEHVNSKKQRVQLAAINALGTLGDTRVIGVLEKFNTLPEKAPERAAAERAITALRDGKKPAAELGMIRTEVLTLQKENRELRKELDELKKRLESLAPKPLITKTNKASKSAKPSKW